MHKHGRRVSDTRAGGKNKEGPVADGKGHDLTTVTALKNRMYFSYSMDTRKAGVAS
jgi:hypothetical protein